MSEQITPEPWLVEKCPCGHPSCDKHGTSNGTFYQGNGYSLADAQIVAASPDLLQALIECLEQAEGCWRNHYGEDPDAVECPVPSHIAAARAAIAKALSPTPAIIRGATDE